MITASDSQCTIDLGKYYAILPADGSTKNKYQDKGIDFKDVPAGFEYNSGKMKVSDCRDKTINH